MKKLDELFVDSLRDIYYAEKLITKDLGEMIKESKDGSLTEGFEDHLEQTQGQIERLEKIFDMLGLAARGKRCAAIHGISDEAKELMEESESDEIMNVSLASAARKVEHYEISAYTNLLLYAKILGYSEAADLLSATLKEEMEVDKQLVTMLETLTKQAV